MSNTETRKAAREIGRDEALDVGHRRMANFTWVYLIGLGSTFIATLAAATQLWEYPLPRSLLLQISWVTALTVAQATTAYIIFDNTHKHGFPYHPKLTEYWKLGTLALGFLLIFFSGHFFYTSLGPLEQFLHCAMEVSKDDLCNLKASETSLEQAARMRALLSK